MSKEVVVVHGVPCVFVNFEEKVGFVGGSANGCHELKCPCYTPISGGVKCGCSEYDLPKNERQYRYECTGGFFCPVGHYIFLKLTK
jgi:hypothetical protein